ncbi:MAG: preprotein translocase subunit SecA [Pirellulaceae bacterium]|nr:preprotein translocase subunit SecA [Pirellulaceae bacterium]
MIAAALSPKTEPIAGGFTHIDRRSDKVDRSPVARERRRRLSDPKWIASILNETHTAARTMRDCGIDQLRQHTGRLKQYLRSGIATDDQRLLTLAGAGVLESIRQATGLDLFDVQLHAGIIVSCSAVAEMQTGEGKTLAGVLPAYVHALAGRGVHVATTNDYLASRDRERLTPIFERLGMTTGLLTDSDSLSQTRAAYEADVTYAAGHVFGFDYLKDQLTLAQQASGPVGSVILNRLRGNDPDASLRQRPLHAAIVDEVDHVLIDDAVSPLLLSSSSQGEAADAAIHLQANALGQELQADRDFVVDQKAGVVELTAAGFDRCYTDVTMAVDRQLIRPWHEYVVLALRAAHLFQRDVHYVTAEDKVQIVDPSTGRIFEDRTWSDGLHQAVLAAENLPITPETEPLAKITRQRFYRQYAMLGGMTGTARGCEKEFAFVYGLPVATVPLRLQSRRQVQAESISNTESDKIAAIGQETESLNRQGRAVLIGTLNIAQSLCVAEELSRLGLDFELLNGVQDANEAAIISKAGRSGAITVATNLAGRGTDIVLDEHVRRLGGLHVIVTERHSLARVDRQLIGRCARCGDPGTARFYTSADDALITKHAPWIRRAILRRTEDRSSVSNSWDKSLARVQHSQQSKATSMRLQMLKLDHETESLLDTSQSPEGCWQL